MKFDFQNPTGVIFGAGNLSRLGEIAGRCGKRALLVTGGGSVKRNGSFDRAVETLQAAGVEVFECSGVEPNPRITTVARGARTAREHDCDMVIALGGGSTMDAAKVMAAAFYYDGDPWDMVHHGQPDVHIPTRALPVITVPTLAATGSEMNMGAVISNTETVQKSAVIAPCLYPKVAVVDPELTLSVPPDQTAYGVCDLITHVTEGYFSWEGTTPIQDRFAEGVILTALEWGPRAVADGTDLEARAQVQWASIVALNGWVHTGLGGAYPVHAIEHTLSAHHDIAHGAGLAIVNPAWMRFSARANPAKFAQFAVRVMGVPAGDNELACALAGIDRYEAFLKSIGCPTRLSEVGIGEELLERYAADTLQVSGRDGKLGGRPPMSAEDIVEVLRTVL